MATNGTDSTITCRSSASWDALEWAVEKAAAVAEKVWTWETCKQETSVAVLLTLFLGLVVLVVILT